MEKWVQLSPRISLREGLDTFTMLTVKGMSARLKWLEADERRRGKSSSVFNFLFLLKLFLVWARRMK